MKDNYHAIVIGGGMTGGYAAKELCQAGLKVLLLERGPEMQHPQSYQNALKKPWEFPYRGIVDATLMASHNVQSHNHIFTAATSDSFVNDKENPYSTPEDKPFYWFRSYQLGGKSLLWGRQSYRWSDLDFSANHKEAVGTDWPVRYKDIEKYYGAVEQFIGVSGMREGLPQLPDGHFLPPMAMNDMEIFAKQKINQKWPERLMTIGRSANLTRNHAGRGACIYRNRCAQGCPQGGYYSALSGAIPAAQATGNLTLQCNAIVERLLYDKVNAKATGVRVIDSSSMQDSEYTADIIFVCAGTLNSTWLLMNSASADGIGNESGQLGHNLMDHHNILVSSLIDGGPATFPQGRRPTPCYLPRYRNLNGGNQDGFSRGYGFEFRAEREDWRRGLSDSSLGAAWKDSLSTWGAWRGTLIGYGETLPHYDNRVELDYGTLDKWGLPALKIQMEFKQNERAMNRDMIDSAITMLAEMGGNKPEVWRSLSVPGRTIHEMGTARMGKHRATSVLDPWNRMWEASNVFVTDGAAMASSACQNPSLTYMAMTARACSKAVSELRHSRA